jgi:hypothetical protein
MLISPSKAQSLARDLINRLQFRFPSTASGTTTFTSIVESFDTNGYPLVTLSNPAAITANGGNSASTPVLVIYIKPISAGSDIFNQPVYAAAPHLTNIWAEEGATAKAFAGVAIADFFTVLFESLQIATQFQLNLGTNNVAITASAVAAGTQAAAVTQFLDWLQWPNKSV